MRDEESRSLVRGLPFRVDRRFGFRPDVRIPPGLLERVDAVLRLFQAQAEAMLELVCEKYGDEAVFCVGVRALVLRYVSLLSPYHTIHWGGFWFRNSLVAFPCCARLALLRLLLWSWSVDDGLID